MAVKNVIALFITIDFIYRFNAAKLREHKIII